MKADVRWGVGMLAALLVGCVIERAPDVVSPPPATSPAVSGTAAPPPSAAPTPLGSSSVSP